MLSYYYLLTIRFGVKEERFARVWEPWMHALAAGWPLGTSIVGAVLGVYHEVELGNGCWINDYPEGCGDGSGEECTSPQIAWFMAGIPGFIMIVSIVVNNLVNFCYVRRQLMRSMRASMNSSVQSERIKDVAKQASLYVVAFIGTYVWSLLLRIMESQSYDAEDEAALFPFLVLQSILVPSTGVFNLLIYLRPRYKRTRELFPNESSIWVFRRAMYGETVREPLENSSNSHSASRLSSSGSQFFQKFSFFKRSMNISTMTPEQPDDMIRSDATNRNSSRENEREHSPDQVLLIEDSKKTLQEVGTEQEGRQEKSNKNNVLEDGNVLHDSWKTGSTHDLSSREEDGTERSNEPTVKKSECDNSD